MAHCTPQRRVMVNGHLSDKFPIRCGNAQGCPLSPILFLFVGEALARPAQDAPEWEGVTVGGFEHFLSQFADDTTLFVKNFQNLPLMWSCVRKYERATGMKVNIKKTEGIRAGALRGEEYDWHANGDVRLTTRLGETPSRFHPLFQHF